MKGRTESKAPAPSSPTPEKNGAPETEKKQTAKKPSKGGRNHKSKGLGNGGKRDRSGRKEKAERLKVLGVSDMLDQHLAEDVEVVEVNAETNARTKTKKPALRAMLDMLRYQALKHKDVRAAKEYLDRTMGRAKQAVEHSGEIITEEEQRLPTKAEKAAARAYLAALDDEDDE